MKVRILEGLTVHLRCLMTFPSDQCVASGSHPRRRPAHSARWTSGISAAVGNVQREGSRPRTAAHGSPAAPRREAGFPSPAPAKPAVPANKAEGDETALSVSLSAGEVCREGGKAARVTKYLYKFS